MSGWFKCFPRRILKSYDALNSDQKAAAYTLTMLIYDHDEPLRMSESMLAGACGFNVRKYRRVLAELVALGKFYISPSGAIGNELADELLAQRESARETGRIGGHKRVANAKAKANVLPIDQQSIDDQNGKLSEKANEDKGTNQGTLGLAFSHKEEDTSLAKAKEGPTAREIIYNTGKAILARQGIDAKAAGTVLGKLLKVKGELEAARIISSIGASPKIDIHDYLWGIINGKPARPLETSNVMPVTLSDGGWLYDATNNELFRLEGDRKVQRPGAISQADKTAIDLIMRFSDARAA